ncbi:hypothetical protein [Nostoc sp. 106C]|jgi:hypothetical protein|uniref:hypothetical protein n=1 Tax=Nostoc sp. 106C TaxID=1932667 RepID=UPI000A38C67D|nr:hypothetical protein [Nostoc sp. 106C]OUL23424.1 hypothetical protein BV378_20985 [Nostoc sp. RF31YmG]OUL27541.1 hypothetical protein BV375_19245 [Nostoc sp. 106C]
MAVDSQVDSVSSPFPRQFDIAKVAVYGLSILSAGMFLFLPFINLLHPSPWQRWLGTIHGFGALLATVVTVYTGHLAFPLLRGVGQILPQMRTLTFWSSAIAFLGIATGNLAYMRYRAGAEVGGARAWLKENSPLAQYVLMEYHEFSVLFTLPLGVACTWILWKYGDSILEKQNRSILTATCVALMAMMFFAMGGLVTGIGVAKIHAL